MSRKKLKNNDLVYCSGAMLRYNSNKRKWVLYEIVDPCYFGKARVKNVGLLERGSPYIEVAETTKGVKNGNQANQCK